jgi:hypothetical protein
LSYFYRQAPAPLIRVPQQHNAPQPFQPAGFQPNYSAANQMANNLVQRVPTPASPTPQPQSQPRLASEQSISYLLEMGFSREEAQFALEQTGNNLQLAMNILTDNY